MVVPSFKRLENAALYKKCAQSSHADADADNIPNHIVVP